MVESPQLATLSEATAEVPDPHVSSVDQVADLLRGLSQPAAATEETPITETPAAEMPATMTALAERLGVDPADLYATRVALGEDREASIGELKDRYREVTELEQERTALQKARGEWEADRTRSSRELEALLAAIDPQHISPRLKAEWERQRSDFLSREREALLRSIPEWSDSVKLAADRKEMEAYLSKYGFSGRDLDQVADHRLLRLIREAARQAKAPEKAPEKVPAKVAVAPRQAKTVTEAQRLGHLKAAVTKGQITPLTAVEALLRGK